MPGGERNGSPAHDAATLCPHAQCAVRNQLIAFPLKVPAFDTYLYWHANTDSDPANAWLRQQLIDALRMARPREKIHVDKAAR
jgi:hypothetical protein